MKFREWSQCKKDEISWIKFMSKVDANKVDIGE